MVVNVEVHCTFFGGRYKFMAAVMAVDGEGKVHCTSYGYKYYAHSHKHTHAHTRTHVQCIAVVFHLIVVNIEVPCTFILRGLGRVDIKWELHGIFYGDRCYAQTHEHTHTHTHSQYVAVVLHLMVVDTRGKS